jgi:hypothetical protein
MKFAMTILATFTLVSCSQDNFGRPPTAPASPTPTPAVKQGAFIWAMVVDEAGVCIVGATVRVVRGQHLGQEITQTTPCDAWDWDGGAVFENLTPGVEMTLRGSAAGYSAQEKTVVPPGPPQALILAVSRAR